MNIVVILLRNLQSIDLQYGQINEPVSAFLRDLSERWLVIT